jgi:hypothetical protein
MKLNTPFGFFSLARLWIGEVCLLAAEFLAHLRRSPSTNWSPRNQRFVTVISAELLCVLSIESGWVRLSSRRLKYHFVFCDYLVFRRAPWLAAMIDARALWVKCFVFLAQKPIYWTLNGKLLPHLMKWSEFCDLMVATIISKGVD